ncbi:FkbM family methyltransferase [Clostridium sp. ZBS2]|uniref:FkbM family methyltransferase n=1 Tax=Clostridium sp. ZBS2 TaxID=2949976 RepID=UPI0020794571|nr:FkbM family methyltransferase [Clostridium sp. ZBS2]
MKLKSFLKRILPLPISSFNREIEILFYKLEQQNCRINESIYDLSNENAILRNKVDILEQLFTKKIEQHEYIYNKFNQYWKEQKDINNKYVQCLEEDKKTSYELYNNLVNENQYTRYMMLESKREINIEFERNYYKDFPTQECNEYTTFQSDFLELIKGLDLESIETILSGLSRLKLIKGLTQENASVYTVEELRQCKIVDENFYSNILQLSENVYYYNNYLLPINHFEACVFYYNYGLEKLETLENIQNKDIIDAGAFIGDSALIFSPLTNKKVYCFEPVPENYNNMLKTVELNNLKNVVPVKSALGSKNGKLQLSVNSSSSTIYENDAFTYNDHIEADVITLDEYVKKNDLNVGLIKADLEGAEQEFLKGAMNTIITQKPILLISIYHNASDFFHIKPMIEKLNLGYSFKIYRPTFGSVLTETLLIAEVKE